MEAQAEGRSFWCWRRGCRLKVDRLRSFISGISRIIAQFGTEKGNVSDLKPRMPAAALHASFRLVLDVLPATLSSSLHDRQGTRPFILHSSTSIYAHGSSGHSLERLCHDRYRVSRCGLHIWRVRKTSLALATQTAYRSGKRTF